MKLMYSFFPWFNQHFIWPFTRLFFGYFLRLSWSGLERLKDAQGKPIIFAANHSSELDPIVFTTCFPFFSRFMPMFYVSRPKKDYRDNPPFKRLVYGGLFFKMWGAFPTFSGKKDYEHSLTHHIRILEMGLPVLIFPEGGIRRSGKHREPRGGVAYLAERTGAVVVPVHIDGLTDMTSKELYARKRRCHISFGQPIEPVSLKAKVEQPQEVYRAQASELVGMIYSLK